MVHYNNNPNWSTEYNREKDEDDEDPKGLKKRTPVIGHISLNDKTAGEISLQPKPAEITKKPTDFNIFKTHSLFTKEFEEPAEATKDKKDTTPEDDDAHKAHQPSVVSPGEAGTHMPDVVYQPPSAMPGEFSQYSTPLVPIGEVLPPYASAEAYSDDDEDDSDELADDGVTQSMPASATYRPLRQTRQAPHPQSQTPNFGPVPLQPPAEFAQQLPVSETYTTYQPFGEMPANAAPIAAEQFAAQRPDDGPVSSNVMPPTELANPNTAEYPTAYPAFATSEWTPSTLAQPDAESPTDLPQNSSAAPLPRHETPVGYPMNAGGRAEMPFAPAGGYNASEFIPPAPQPAPEQEIITHNYDPRVPAVVAVGAGVALAERHFRRKGDEKVAKNAAAENQKVQTQVEALQAAQVRAQRQQEAQAQANRYNQASAQSQRFNVAPTPQAARPNQQPQTAMQNSSAERMSFGSAENATFANNSRVAQERQQQTAAGKEKVPVADAQAAVEAALSSSNRTLKPEEIKKVRSEWLEINVDQRTGQAVEHDYGQAYHQERRAEQFPGSPNDNGQTNKRSTNNSGATANNSGQANEYLLTTGAINPSLPRPIQEPMLPPGQPSRVDPQHRLKASDRTITSNLSNPWFWLILGLLIVAYFGRSAL